MLLLAALVMFAGEAVMAREDAIRPLSAFPREPLVIETRSARRHLFEAWRADTAATRSQGLMFVEKLPADRAMIFVYPTEQIVGMWMKNTLIPLDMLFVDGGGCIVKVHEAAQPGSLTTIWSRVPVMLVVELAGGTAKTLGISAGDRTLRPDAGWPAVAAPCTPTR